MMRTGFSLFLLQVIIAKAVQSAQSTCTKAGTPSLSIDFIVMVMEGDDAGLFDFNVLLDLQRIRFDHQSQTTDLDKQFNLEVQQLLKDYSGLAAALSSLPSAPILGNPASMLTDHFELAFKNLTDDKSAKELLLQKSYDQAVQDYLAPKGEQAMSYARTIISMSVSAYSQFVMRLGSYLTQLQMAAASCSQRYSNSSCTFAAEVESACLKHEVQILEDYVYKLILKATVYLDNVRKGVGTNIATVTIATDSITSTTPASSTIPQAILSTASSAVQTEPATGSPSPMAGSGSGDEGDAESTKPPNPHLLPPDDEDSQVEASTTSDSKGSTGTTPTTPTPTTGTPTSPHDVTTPSTATPTRPHDVTTPTAATPTRPHDVTTPTTATPTRPHDVTTPTTAAPTGSKDVGTIGTTPGSGLGNVVTIALPIVNQQHAAQHQAAEQVETLPSATEKNNDVGVKGHHGNDKGTPLIHGSVTITSGSIQSSNSSADLLTWKMSSVVMVSALIGCAVGLIVVAVLTAVVCCVMCVRKSSRAGMKHIPLTEEEVVDSMKKNGFVNPTYTFFSK